MIETTGRDRLWHYGLAGALMLAGPLARELYYGRYPLASTEALILVLGLAVTGAVIAVVGSRLGRFLSGVVFAALFLVFLDLQFEFDRLGVLAGVAAACLVLSLLLSRWRATITGLALGVFYLASLPFKSPDDQTIRNSRESTGQVALGPIIHIILDEHLGIGGFRAVGDTLTAGFLTDFYVRRGFDVYPGAYSRFNTTRQSIASVLSLGELDESAMLLPYPVDRSPTPLLSNPYFARLAGDGHLINVYESANLDYCRTGRIEVATCIKVPPRSVANISALRIPWRQKAQLVLEQHLVRSSRLRSLVPQLRELEAPRIFAVRAVELLRAAGDDLARRRNRVDFFFAHVLLPHDPNEIDGQCVTYLERRRARSTFTPTPDSLRTKEARYRAQVRCINRVVGQFIDQIDQAFGPNQAVIIVHGDHGSRSMYRCQPNIYCRAPAATAENVKRYRPLDFTGEFATLLAVRGPDSKGGVHWEPTPLQDFLWAFIKSGFKTVPVTPWQHYIYLNETRVRTAHPLQPADMLWTRSGK